MGFQRHALALRGGPGREVGRADLMRALAEVFAFVVEGMARIDFDLQAGEGEGPAPAIDDANGDLAADEELLDEVGHAERRGLSDDGIAIAVAVEEEEPAARTASQ